MRLLNKWPIPETTACLIIVGIAGDVIANLPPSILAGTVVGLIAYIIGIHVRKKYDSGY